MITGYGRRSVVIAAVLVAGGCARHSASADPTHVAARAETARTATGPGTGASGTGPTASGPTASGPTASGPTASGPTASGPTASGPTASGPPGATPTTPRWTPRAGDDTTPHHPIEFPEELAPFFEQLARVDDGTQAIARVLHFGASMIGMDDLTGVLRDRFQTRFGDGGAGLVLMQRYMTNYMHRSVLLDGRGWEHCYIAHLCRKDGHYGLGGVTFTSTASARTTVATRREGFGSTASRLEVWYAATPQGGKLAVRVDGKEPEILDTRAAALEDRWHAIDVEPGAHEIDIHPYGAPVRAYGVVLETDGPGVVWDQFSMLGAFTKRMLAWGEDHIKGQIARRDPHLVVFTYGGNDLRRFATGKLDVAQYTDEFAESIERVLAGKPDAACLVVGISDRGRTWTHEVEAEHMANVTESHRQAAARAGCAFFDTYAAMGGVGSAKRWRAKDPPLAAGDLKHLTHAGNVVLGGWIYDAIVHEYVRHRLAAPGSTPEG